MLLPAQYGRGSWTTFGGDPQRTGWNKTETDLTPESVKNLKLEWSVKLDSGDILVFYSDGLTEASNRDGKFFGARRLQALLESNAHRSSGEIADRMLEEVQEFTQGGAITDDRTLVVMKVK